MDAIAAIGKGRTDTPPRKLILGDLAGWILFIMNIFCLQFDGDRGVGTSEYT